MKMSFMGILMIYQTSYLKYLKINKENAIGSLKFNEFVEAHEINKEKKNLLCVDDFQGNQKVD